MNLNRNKTARISLVVLFIILLANIVYAAVPQSTVRTTGAGITTYVGHYLNGTLGWYQGTTQRLDAAGNAVFVTLDTGQGANELYDMDQNVLTTSDVNFSSVEADQYFLNAVNITDIVAYPQTETSYIIWTDNSTGTPYFYAKNGTTGNIDYNGTDATTIINNAITASPSYSEIKINSGRYDLTGTIHLKDRVSITGTSGTYGVHLWASDKTFDILSFITTANGQGYFHVKDLALHWGKKGVYISHDGGNFAQYEIRLQNIDVFESGEEGFYLGGASAQFYWGVVEHCTADHTGKDGFYMILLESWVLDCFAIQCQDSGIYVTGPSQYYHIINPTVRYVEGAGVWLGGSFGELIGAEIIDFNEDYSNDFAGVIINGGAMTIMGNNIRNTEATGGRQGIKMLIGTNCRLIGNTVTATVGNPYVYGIRGSSVTIDNVITGNILEHCTTYFYGLNFGDNQIADSHSELFMDVLAVSATHVRSNEDLSAGLPLTFTIDAQPDIPRTLSGHFDSHAQITAYTITVTGVDAQGSVRSEVLTAANGWDWETNNAYGTITSIIMTVRTGTGAGDTMDIGITDVIGLSNEIYLTSDVYKIKKNNVSAIVAIAQVNAIYDTYDMSVITLGVWDDFTIWYLTNLNILT